MTRMTLLLSILCLNSFLASNRAIAIPASLDPEPRLVTYRWMALSAWYEMHAEDTALATKGGSPLVFIGDSITQGWNGAGKAIWDKHFAPMGAANFGIGGDMTQNLLWRLQYGATENLDPKAVVLLIGTNNFAFTEDSPERIAAGIIAVVDRLKKSYPNADILALGVFPRSESSNHSIRPRIKRINRIVASLNARERVDYLDIGIPLRNRTGPFRRTSCPTSYTSPRRATADGLTPFFPG